MRYCSYLLNVYFVTDDITLIICLKIYKFNYSFKSIDLYIVDMHSFIDFYDKCISVMYSFHSKRCITKRYYTKSLWTRFSEIYNNGSFYLIGALLFGPQYLYTNTGIAIIYVR